MSGRVMSKKARGADAPRSRAASPMAGSSPASRALTLMKMYGTQKVVCASTSVSMPKGRRRKEKNARYAMPRMISGTMMGMRERFSSAPRPRKCLPAMPTAPTVPSTEADRLLSAASSRLLKKAVMIFRLWSSFWYQEK